MRVKMITEAKALEAGAAIVTGLAYFQAIPWSDIAAFIACMYYIYRFGHWMCKKHK